MTEIHKEMIPSEFVAALKRYVHHGILPGSFLQAVLKNDLREACGRADHIRKYTIWDYVAFCHNYIPAGCWGSPEAVADWVAAVKMQARGKNEKG